MWCGLTGLVPRTIWPSPACAPRSLRRLPGPSQSVACLALPPAWLGHGWAGSQRVPQRGARLRTVEWRSPGCNFRSLSGPNDMPHWSKRGAAEPPRAPRSTTTLPPQPPPHVIPHPDRGSPSAASSESTAVGWDWCRGACSACSPTQVTPGRKTSSAALKLFPIILRLRYQF